MRTSVCCLTSIMMLSSGVFAQQVVDTSESHSTVEKVLRLEVMVPAPKARVWEAFATEAGLQQWAAPVIELDLRSGGAMYAHYNPDAEIGSPGTIHTTIQNVVAGELITYKVNLNESFPASIQAQDDYLQEIVQLEAVDANTTRIISTMVGWGEGQEWDAAYDFFARGNAWTYEQLLKTFE